MSLTACIFYSQETEKMSLKRKPPAGDVRRVSAIGSNARGTITNKAGRIVQFESFAERSLLLRLDRDWAVRDYASQPEQFKHQVEQGRQQVYTPDFIVWRENGDIEIYEVTRTERRTQEHAITREEMAQIICHDRGWTFRVHTEKDLPQGAELANLLGLFRYRPRGYRNEGITNAAYAYFAIHTQAAINDLMLHLAETEQVPQSTVAANLCHLLWHDELATCWQRSIFRDARFAASTLVWMPVRGTDEQLR
jgi:hypothetical protein